MNLLDFNKLSYPIDYTTLFYIRYEYEKLLMTKFHRNEKLWIMIQITKMFVFHLFKLVIWAMFTICWVLFKQVIVMDVRIKRGMIILVPFKNVYVYNMQKYTARLYNFDVYVLIRVPYVSTSLNRSWNTNEQIFIVNVKRSFFANTKKNYFDIVISTLNRKKWQQNERSFEF